MENEKLAAAAKSAGEAFAELTKEPPKYRITVERAGSETQTIECIAFAVGCVTDETEDARKISTSLSGQPTNIYAAIDRLQDRLIEICPGIAAHIMGSVMADFLKD